MIIFPFLDNEDFDVIGSDRGFPIGSVSGDFFCYEVIFIDDNILEGDESLIISLTSDAATTTNLTVIVQDHTDLNGNQAGSKMLKCSYRPIHFS